MAEFNVTVTDWDTAKGSAFYVNYGFSGVDAAAYKTSSSAQLEFTVKSKADYVPNPTMVLTEEGLTVGTYKFDGLTATASGEGFVLSLTLPAGVVGPANGAELAGWGMQMDEARRMQDDNTTGGEAEQSETEAETLEEYKVHLDTYFHKGKKTAVYSSEQVITIGQPEETGLWAETEYTVYVTFEDAYSNDSMTYFSNVHTAAVTTSDLPADMFTSVNIKSNSKPTGDTLHGICNSYASAVGIKKSQANCDEDNVSAARRGRRLSTSWKVVVKIMADPSGQNTQSPQYIVQEKSSSKCPSCVDAFQAGLAANSATSSIEADSFASDSTS